jgi:hypothetical protein
MQSREYTDVSEGGTASIPADECSTYLWNVGLLQREYTALYPRKFLSSQIKSTGKMRKYYWLFQVCGVWREDCNLMG